MGMIQGLAGVLFGNGTNVLRETAEVFRENAEAGAARTADLHRGAVAEFAAEFGSRGAGGRGRFDLFMDGLNRLPRPALALGTLGLLCSAMIDPLWFGARMQGLALVPEPLWWLLGAIVSFYFGARHQLKGQEFQNSVARSLSHAPAVLSNLAELRELAGSTVGSTRPDEEQGLASRSEAVAQMASVAGEAVAGTAALTSGATQQEPNAALEAWRASRS